MAAAADEFGALQAKDLLVRKLRTVRTFGRCLPLEQCHTSDQTQL